MGVPRERRGLVPAFRRSLPAYHQTEEDRLIRIPPQQPSIRVIWQRRAIFFVARGPILAYTPRSRPQPRRSAARDPVLPQSQGPLVSSRGVRVRAPTPTLVIRMRAQPNVGS